MILGVLYDASQSRLRIMYEFAAGSTKEEGLSEEGNSMHYLLERIVTCRVWLCHGF